jgi:hypothetical protein
MAETKMLASRTNEHRAGTLASILTMIKSSRVEGFTGRQQTPKCMSMDRVRKRQQERGQHIPILA